MTTKGITMNVEPAGHSAGVYLRALGLSDGRAASLEAFLAGQNRPAAKAAMLTHKAVIGTTTDADWAAAATAPSAVTDFIATMTPFSAIAQLPLRRVPYQVRLVNSTEAVGATVVGEGLPTPITFGGIAGFTLDNGKKTIGEILLTKEMLAAMDPASERGLAEDLASATAKAQDAQFLTDIASGQPTTSSTGSTLAQTDADLKAAIAKFGGDLRRAHWVLAPETAAYLTLLRGTGGALAHPGMTPRGGTLVGLPAVVSEGAVQVNSPNDNDIYLIDPSRVAYNDGGVELGRSTQANVQVSATPDNPVTASTVTVSLWQHNLVALRATRWGAWHALAGAVSVITNAAY